MALTPQPLYAVAAAAVAFSCPPVDKEFREHVWGTILPMALLRIGASALLIRCELTPVSRAADWARNLQPGAVTPPPAGPVPTEVADLIENAVLHAGPGEVEVTVGSNHTLSVRDQGPGLSPQALPRMFDPFWRAPGAVPGEQGLGWPSWTGCNAPKVARLQRRGRRGAGVESFCLLILSNSENPSLCGQTQAP